ncbi:hypothetical protein M758_7G124200 [Ceratodon purpureus]|uniref:Uncharacterized protein n=1 Tax=Ceratodon purpureus TaxID=3225 RepID=A0A8T0H6U1_CERPU|nr:hypothetical protein KC19_7G153600 [Ceratodon purpureus]KAG0611220.1 hypothetical protein M758_7G124200 [Ceratodon purpureus]
MALLYRCLPQCSSSVVLASNLNVKGTRVQTVSQCRPSLVCRAASNSNGSEGDGAAQTPAVFKDDSNGIVCFTNEDGEVVCEGWDEGPHFQPEPEKGYTMRKRITTRPSGKARGEGEPAVGFKSTGAKMQESISEDVTAETSFNSSEL